MQEDVVLRIPKCNAMQIAACDDKLSTQVVMRMEEDQVITTDELICQKAVPGGCPRIQCMKKGVGYQPCRLLGLIQSQENESGFWMKLPCSECEEKTRLSPVTKGFVYDDG